MPIIPELHDSASSVMLALPSGVIRSRPVESETERRYGPQCRQSCLEHGGQGGHVFGPLDLEAILVVDGGEIFEQLGDSQHVRCHKHMDLGIEIVNRECLRKHETVWHAEREFQSNL